MIALLKRWSERNSGMSLGLPQPDAPTFVVGDVHGRFDLLTQLLERCPPHVVDIVFLGDLVDRGEDSAQVVRHVMALAEARPGIVCLRGNHEDMLLDFLEDPQAAGPRWLKCGGLQTLTSFGIRGLSVHSTGDVLEAAAIRLAQVMTPQMITWIKRRPLIWQSGTLVAVHAAAAPDLPMNSQDEDTLLWGHERFLLVPRSDGLWVAHGHTFVDEPVCAHSRISLDTGACYTGRLTGAMVEPDGSVQFLSASG